LSIVVTPTKIYIQPVYFIKYYISYRVQYIGRINNEFLKRRQNFSKVLFLFK